jgi:hypothetical protein
MFSMCYKSKPNKPSQREFYSLKNAHKIPCLGRYVSKGVQWISLTKN